jgi:hypothetical protein
MASYGQIEDLLNYQYILFVLIPHLILSMSPFFFFSVVVNDWNRIVVQFTGSITEYLHTDSVLNLLNKQFLLKEGSNATSAVCDTDIPNPNSVNVNKIAQRTLLWNSKRPWTIDTTVDFIDIGHRNGEKDKGISRIMGGGGGLGAESGGSLSGNDKNNFYHGAHDKNGKPPVSGNFAAEEVSWASLLKASRNKNSEKSSIATTLLNNITRKPAKPSNTEESSGVKKCPRTTQSAFTSYLQDLME